MNDLEIRKEIASFKSELNDAEMAFKKRAEELVVKAMECRCSEIDEDGVRLISYGDLSEESVYIESNGDLSGYDEESGEEILVLEEVSTLCEKDGRVWVVTERCCPDFKELCLNDIEQLLDCIDGFLFTEENEKELSKG